MVNMLNYKKYRSTPVMDLTARAWPNKQIRNAPRWCSVDLRDGNQALPELMVLEEKFEFFQLLVRLGFKEIEIGFPAASQGEFDFLRQLVERRMIPDDVSVQVLAECREHLIKRTFEAVREVKKVILHIHNSTSVLMRDVVLKKSREEIQQIAVDGVRLVRKYAEGFDGELLLQYSPEGFTETEMDHALSICTAVWEAWGLATPEKPLIINLPSTVEVATPNVYADQIEWMNHNLKERDSIIVSIHPHNDRGTAVAAAELALMAGAERVEGTLFGNGERTGNVDILTLACNLFSQGINPKLSLERLQEITEIYERCTKMPIHPRHPYVGSLVFTAFSGSHQDAVSQGLRAMREKQSPCWEVPYLPVDPSDIGRKYEPVVRINSHSPKGGVAFVMETFYGFKLPKGMHKEFADLIQRRSEKQGEVSPEQILNDFKTSYLKKEPLHFRKCQITDTEIEPDVFTTLATVLYSHNGLEKSFEGLGNGPIDAVQRGLEDALAIRIKVLDYSEHALGSGSSAQAASYIHVMDQLSGKTAYGVGISSNITRASLRGIFSAVNRLFYT